VKLVTRCRSTQGPNGESVGSLAAAQAGPINAARGNGAVLGLAAIECFWNLHNQLFAEFHLVATISLLCWVIRYEYFCVVSVPSLDTGRSARPLVARGAAASLKASLGGANSAQFALNQLYREWGYLDEMKYVLICLLTAAGAIPLIGWKILARTLVRFQNSGVLCLTERRLADCVDTQTHQQCECESVVHSD
jgi:hypothetical protein